MRILSFLLAALLALPAYAGTGNSSITVTPRTQTEASDNISAGAWTNVANCKVVDGFVGSVNLKVGWRTNSLDYTTNIIPTVNAAYQTVLSGFAITVRADTTDTSVPLTLHMQLINNTGNPIGTAQTIDIVDGTLTDYTFGGEEDLWGQSTWVGPESVLSKNFGWRIWVTNDDTGGTGGSASPEIDGSSTIVYFYRRHTLGSSGAGL